MVMVKPQISGDQGAAGDILEVVLGLGSRVLSQLVVAAHRLSVVLIYVQQLNTNLPSISSYLEKQFQEMKHYQTAYLIFQAIMTMD